ncbi:MAG: alpha/beta hydrolase [Planctomyces sp.]|nr:alpha/beta hydrolase [Planctomyces sp.]
MLNRFSSRSCASRHHCCLGFVWMALFFMVVASGCGAKNESRRVEESASAGTAGPDAISDSDGIPGEFDPESVVGTEGAGAGSEWPGAGAGADWPGTGVTDVVPTPVEPAAPEEPAGSDEMASPEEIVRSTEVPVDTEPAVVIRRGGQEVERKGFSREQVYFVTNREQAVIEEGMSDPDTFFGATTGPLSFGVCDVSIPYKRPPGTLPEPSVLKFEFSQDPAKHVVLMQIECVNEVQFWSSLSTSVSAGDDRQLLVYVHGFSASFRDAARRTAQMAYDMNYPGPAMFFSWPAGSSEEGLNRWNYTNDLRRADESRDAMVEILTQLAQRTGARRIHLVAHSMGNHLLTESLRIMCDQAGGPKKVQPMFDAIAMAAPDVNAQHFSKSTVNRIQGFSRQFTIYASRYDKALKFSEQLNGWKTLGSINEFSKEVDALDRWDVVDVSDVSSDLFSTGHTYYGDMPEVMLDLASMFAGTPIPKRGLLAASPAWRLLRRQ